MNGHFTFALIKPTAVLQNHTAEILTHISKTGFKIVALKMVQVSQKEAESFYEVHKNKPFYKELTQYLATSPIVVMVLEKENAVQNFRNFIGVTDPKDAAEGSIRKIFGITRQANAIHGSDSDENAIRETFFFFSEREIFSEINLS